MRKVLVLALLAVALVAMPAFASVQNIKVSGDIDSTWVVRDQFDLGENDSGVQNYHQNFLMTQTRLRVDADLTDNVSATVALINERVWNNDDDDQDGSGSSGDVGANDIDLNLAFVELREMLYSPLTVIIGRQSFAFGNSFVIDSAGTNRTVSTGGLSLVAEDFTKRTAHDAIRLVLDYNPLTLDLVASKINANEVGGVGQHDDDVDLFGINANYQLGDDMNTVIEAYFWNKNDQSLKSGGAGRKTDTVYMPGIHVSTNPLKGLMLSGEIAWQFGNKTITDTTTPATPDNVRREALGIQAIANYLLPFEKTAQYNPVLTTVYTYVSGDSNTAEAGTATGDDHYTAWDPMFENQGGGAIYNTLFDLTNVHILILKAQANPIEDVTTSLSWTGMWLDKEIAAAGEAFVGDCEGTTCFPLYQPDGTTINPRVTSNTVVGQEIGGQVTYDYTEDVQFGARYDVFIPGGMFHRENDQYASQWILNANVIF